MISHHNGQRFLNPSFPSIRGYWQLLRFLATRRKQAWPRWIEDPMQPPPPACINGEAIAATFVNQSTFLIQFHGVNLLTDPVWSNRASPLQWAGPKRVRRPGVDFEQLPPVHVVLVSHNHYDHMDVLTLRRLQERFAPLFITGMGNRRFLLAQGLGQVEELDWWQTLTTQTGLQVTMTPAQHFSARGPFDRNRTLWGGFVVEAGGRSVYFTGDSGYADHFEAIGQRWGGFDLALIPIGAYEPRWFMKPAHMNPEEAVRAHRDVRSRQSIAMHFGTFQLTDEAIEEPIRALRESLACHGIEESRFCVPGFGETILVSSQVNLATPC
jgi:L-ascorbate metabolism protein UlaG (beta-lactamase superfamily)